MIKSKVKEFSKNGLAIRTIEVTFIGIPIYSYEKTSTNKAAVAQLTAVSEPTKIKGYLNETKNKSKKA